ncbi:hypothetical protein [Streptomyces bluensis]|uniref:hypothetical protein n=1 Tax=Streptomyces bluensis TaxID=33897 RepID=UPI0033202338
MSRKHAALDVSDSDEDPGLGLDALPAMWRARTAQPGAALQTPSPDRVVKGNP